MNENNDSGIAVGQGLVDQITNTGNQITYNPNLTTTDINNVIWKTATTTTTPTVDFGSIDWDSIAALDRLKYGPGVPAPPIVVKEKKLRIHSFGKALWLHEEQGELMGNIFTTGTSITSTAPLTLDGSITMTAKEIEEKFGIVFQGSTNTNIV